jgi:hypothetical protein
MEFIIEIDFITSLITNSSSTVYSEATSVEAMHELLNEVIQAVGGIRKSEDVFDISIYLDIDYLIDCVTDEPDCYEHLIPEEDYPTGLFEIEWGNDGHGKKVDFITTRLTDMNNDGKIENEEAAYDGFIDTRYLVKLKNGKDTRIGSLVQQLFSHEATRG